MLQTATYAQVAAENLERLSRESAPGVRMGSKDDLRRKLGVSHGVLNEALRLVQVRGLVDVRRGPAGGVFSAEPTPTVRLGNSVLALDDAAASVSDAVRLREALDPLVIEDAAANAVATDIDMMQAALSLMRQAMADDDDEAFFRANLKLHARIGEVTPNLMLRSFYLGLLDIISSHTVQISPRERERSSDYFSARYELHVELVEAVASRNQAWVRDVARRHAATTFAERGSDADGV